MKCWRKKIVLLVVACSSLFFVRPSHENAAESDRTTDRADQMSQQGKVSVEDSGKTDPVDPENPGDIADPGVGPSTKGTLRIDYVSALNFGTVKIKAKDRNYQALAQNFYGETGPRGSYVQITDRRSEKSGWTLQVKQNYQFKNEIIQEANEQELRGAVLSLDKGWANSLPQNPAPIVTRNTIALNNIGQAYEVAKADENAGQGVWIIAFGASETNPYNQPNSLTPVKDESGKSVLDTSYQKPAYYNSAIQLNLPAEIKVYPVQYQPELTWILSEFP